MESKVTEISNHKNLLDFRFKELYNYIDLLFLFVKRDLIVVYKQTILGPIWFLIQPILTTTMYLIVFNRIAGISTDGIPPAVFYLAGITVWNYFGECLRLTSDTFVKNASIFGKVYFPRFIMPLSVVISNLVKFTIQLFLFLSVYFYYYFTLDTLVPNSNLIYIPILIFILATLSLSFGLLISALTTKYRDLFFLVQFGVQLWMYATPVIYPVSSIPEKYQHYVMLNPVAPIVEAFKYSFTGTGVFSTPYLIYSFGFAIVFFLISLIIFNKTEKNFMDTV